MSSGFDSSFLTANQISLFGSKNVTGHTVIQKISKEVKFITLLKSKNFKTQKHFGFNLKFTEVNLVKNFQKYSEEISQTSSDRMMTNTLAAFMHYKLANSCKTLGSSNEAYTGEVMMVFIILDFHNFFRLLIMSQMVLESILIKS